MSKYDVLNGEKTAELLSKINFNRGDEYDNKTRSLKKMWFKDNVKTTVVEGKLLRETQKAYQLDVKCKIYENHKFYKVWFPKSKSIAIAKNIKGDDTIYFLEVEDWLLLAKAKDLKDYLFKIRLDNNQTSPSNSEHVFNFAYLEENTEVFEAHLPVFDEGFKWISLIYKEKFGQKNIKNKKTQDHREKEAEALAIALQMELELLEL